jgi:single-strand DNA-binding protein
MSVNKVILVGHLGKDPEVRFTNTGSAVANFSIATSEQWNDRDGKKQERTEWHNIVVWRKLADVAEKYVTKGQLLYIEGKIRNKSWEDKDGNRKFATEVVGDNLIMLDKRTDSTHGSHGPAASHGENIEGFSADIPPISDSPSQDLPF